MKDVVTDAGEGSKLSRANRPIQNKIGDGRKIAPVIDELKIELVIEEPNSGLLIEQLKVEQFTEGRRIAHLKRRKLKIDFSIFGRIQEWIVINQNRILTTWRAQNCAFPFLDCHLEQI